VAILKGLSQMKWFGTREIAEDRPNRFYLLQGLLANPLIRYWQMPIRQGISLALWTLVTFQKANAPEHRRVSHI
jgi:hypothetical protein